MEESAIKITDDTADKGVIEIPAPEPEREYSLVELLAAQRPAEPA